MSNGALVCLKRRETYTRLHDVTFHKTEISSSLQWRRSYKIFALLFPVRSWHNPFASHKLRTGECVANYNVKISIQHKCLRGGMSSAFTVPLLSPNPYRRLFSAVVLREYLTRCVLYRLVLVGVIGLWKWVSYQANACDWQIRIDLQLQCSDCHNRMDFQGRSGDVTHKTAP
jgi:hypothetical protein